MKEKITKFVFIISFIIAQSYGQDLKCENEGCYEVIKTFVNLLEEKINETDKILAEAETELNQVTFGSDEKFQKAILELDNKLTKLLIDMNKKVDGTDHSLFELLNIVLKSVNRTESNANLIELALDDGNKIRKIAEIEFSNIQETVMAVQAELNKLKNRTEIDLPNALQDAFDRSEKFDSEAKDLHEISSKMRSMLADYERNLLNAKELLVQTVKKFSQVSEQINSKSKIQNEIEEMFKVTSETELPVHELEAVKKLIIEAMDKAKSVSEDSMELFNEVSLLEMYGKFDDIKTKILELENYSKTTEVDLKIFSYKNIQFLDEMEATIDKAGEIQGKAVKQQKEIEDILKKIQDIEAVARKSIHDKDEIIKNARNIHKTLEDFNMKVEESRELARRATEKIPEILKQISESKEIVKNLENQVEENLKMSIDTKKECESTKAQMDKILKQSENIKNSVETVTEKLEENFEKMSEINKVQEENLKIHDNVKKTENETETALQKVKEKFERTKSKIKNVDENVDAALEEVGGLIEQIKVLSDVDMKNIDELENIVDQLENDIRESKFLEKYKTTKEQYHRQKELIERYRLEIAVLEHEVKTIKENADSLENKCFKRTRLEP